ncbi:hypothetical protein X975_12883, partial [Stegodyphus mimosarum]
MGLCSQRPKHAPALMARHHQLRQQWAKKHRNWTLEEWMKLAWSDELHFLVHHIDGHVLICHFPNETLAPRCTVGQKRCRWWDYYGMDNVFMEHIRTHNPHRTISDICALCEHHCKPGSSIHDKCIFGRGCVY